MQPPKNWRKKEMNADQFKEYILSHRIIGGEEEISILDYFKQIRPNYADKFSCVMDLVTMFPHEYQMDVAKIFGKYVDDPVYEDKYDILIQEMASLHARLFKLESAQSLK